MSIPGGLPDTAETRKDMEEYAEATRLMDAAAGILLDALKETRHDKETFIFLTTDHSVTSPLIALTNNLKNTPKISS